MHAPAMRRVDGDLPKASSIGISADMPDDIQLGDPPPSAHLACSSAVTPMNNGVSSLALPSATKPKPLQKITAHLVKSVDGIHKSQLQEKHHGKVWNCRHCL